MSNQPADDQRLTELRRASEALRQLPSAKRAQAAKPRYPEFRALIAKAVAAPIPFEDVARELSVFPPGVVGHAVSTVWESLSAEARAQVVQRLRALDAERHVGEGVPLAMQLLRTPSSAGAGAEVMSGLPASEKTVQRVATDLFGADGTPMQHLAAPTDVRSAVKLWRLLFKAAAHEKAQPWRRFQFLKLVLEWLVESDRSEDPRNRELVTQCRDLAQRLDTTAGSSLKEELEQREPWREILGSERGADSAPPSPARVGPVGTPARPIVSTTPAGPQTERLSRHAESDLRPEPAREATLSIEEARDTLTKARHRHEREMRAIDRLLGAERAAEARHRQLEGDIKHTRDQLRRREIELDDLRGEFDRVRSAIADADRRHDSAVNESRELQQEVKQLREQMKAQVEQVAALRAAAESERDAWAEQKKQLEGQVLEHATIKLDEFRQRMGRKVSEMTRDLHPRKSSMDGNTVAAVLNTRLHEVLDFLAEEGLPIRSRD